MPNINLNLDRPLSLARYMVVANVDCRKKFRLIVKAADSLGRNLEVLDETHTYRSLEARLKDKVRFRSVIGKPVAWTVVVLHPDEVLVRTVPFTKPL